MSGLVNNLVLPKTTFDWSSLAVHSTPIYTVAEHIDVSQYIEAAFEIRVHGGNIVATGSAVTVYALADAPTMEDPFKDFVSTVSTNIKITFSTAGTIAPALYVLSPPAPFGYSLRLQLKPDNAGPLETFQVALSVVLVAKSGPRA